MSLTESPRTKTGAGQTNRKPTLARQQFIVSPLWSLYPRMWAVSSVGYFAIFGTPLIKAFYPVDGSYTTSPCNIALMGILALVGLWFALVVDIWKRQHGFIVRKEQVLWRSVWLMLRMLWRSLGLGIVAWLLAELWVPGYAGFPLMFSALMAVPAAAFIGAVTQWLFDKSALTDPL